jgi:serine/threonine protein kinase
VLVDEQQISEARVGTQLRGKWTLERLIGVGGMAAVYAARHTIGRLDAIKILHPAVARSSDVRARFEQEAHAVNRLKHPGAVEIRDTDISEDGAPFMVMELLEGESLSDRAQRLGGISLEDTLRYADETLDVLAAAHAQGIIHRDIKLDNLFILKDGRLKVLDFGIARMREGAPKTLHTRTGAMLGTLTYMAPEQVRGGAIDARADIFAVGATMFRLITNRRLHEGRSEADLLVKMAMEPAPSLSSVAPATPREVCLIVDRALAFDREQRYPDAAAMQSDVRGARAGAAPRDAPGVNFGNAPTILSFAGGPPPSAARIRAEPSRVSAVVDAISTVWGESTKTKGADDKHGRWVLLAALLAIAGFLVLMGGMVGFWCVGRASPSSAGTPAAQGTITTPAALEGPGTWPSPQGKKESGGKPRKDRGKKDD